MLRTCADIVSASTTISFSDFTKKDPGATRERKLNMGPAWLDTSTIEKPFVGPDC